MDRSLLDTDILSEILKGRDPNVVANAAAYLSGFGDYLVSTITVIEIVRGLHRRGREEEIQQSLTLPNIRLLTLDLRAAELAGRIDADLERSGQSIGPIDPMIAAIALRHNLTLVTGNLFHYQRIQALGYELHLDNWRTQ